MHTVKPTPRKDGRNKLRLWGKLGRYCITDETDSFVSMLGDEPSSILPHLHPLAAAARYDTWAIATKLGAIETN